jgi:two-component sensor histidine kinase
MQFSSDLAAGLSCLSAALAILVYLRKRHSAARRSRRAGAAAIAGLLALGFAHLFDLAGAQFPGAVWLDVAQLVALGVALAISLLIWSLLPGLLAEPSPGELLETNRALNGAAELRAAELARLAAAKAELERAVADRAQALDESNQRFEKALTNSDISMAQQDCDLRYVWVHNAPKGIAAATLLGRLQKDVLPPAADRILTAAKRGAMMEKKAAALDVDIEIDGVLRQFHENVEPLWREGEVVGVLTTSIETTAYRRRQEELRGLLRELTHRTKNLLAVIMGIARQSGRSSTDVASFVARFNGRIRALAVTHELLVESEWRGVGLRQLIAGVWRAASQKTGDLLALDGPDLILTPESAQNLALGLHEMRANSFADAGIPEADRHVKISWASSDDGVRLLWEETRGTGANADEQGDDFGKAFVETLLPRAVMGESEVSLHPREQGAVSSTLVWTLQMPPLNFVFDPSPARQTETSPTI